MRSKFFAVSFFICSIFLGASSPAKAIEVSGSASAAIYSEYVWRGMTYSNDWVMQSYLEQSYKNVTLNIWANYDSESSEMNEADWTLSYSKSFDKLSLMAGYSYYGFDSIPDAKELYLWAGYDTFLSPSLTFYHETGEGTGSVLVATIGHSLPISDALTLNLGANASYNMKETMMGTDANGKRFNGLYNGELSLSATYQFNKEVTIEPIISYSTHLSSDAEYAIANMSVDGEDSVTYGGVAITVSF